MLLTILGEIQSDFCKNLTEFYQISLKNLPYLADFSPQLMACMREWGVGTEGLGVMSNNVTQDLKYSQVRQVGGGGVRPTNTVAQL